MPLAEIKTAGVIIAVSTPSDAVKASIEYAFYLLVGDRANLERGMTVSVGSASRSTPKI